MSVCVSAPRERLGHEDGTRMQHAAARRVRIDGISVSAQMLLGSRRRTFAMACPADSFQGSKLLPFPAGEKKRPTGRDCDLDPIRLVNLGFVLRPPLSERYIALHSVCFFREHVTWHTIHSAIVHITILSMYLLSFPENWRSASRSWTSCQAAVQICTR